MNEHIHVQRQHKANPHTMHEDAFLLDLAFGGSLYDEARRDIFKLARINQEERL